MGFVVELQYSSYVSQILINSHQHRWDCEENFSGCSY
jgi:hypothetical protein